MEGARRARCRRPHGHGHGAVPRAYGADYAGSPRHRRGRAPTQRDPRAGVRMVVLSRSHGRRRGPLVRARQEDRRGCRANDQHHLRDGSAERGLASARQPDAGRGHPTQHRVGRNAGMD